MYKYKCKSVGDCSVANRGELITSETMLNDPKCSDCGCALELMDKGGAGGNAAEKGGRKIGAVLAVAAAVLVLAGGGSWYAFGGATKPAANARATPPEPVAQPTFVVAAPGISPSETETSQARRDADKQLGKGEFSEAERKAARAAALEMIKTAVAKMGQGDLAGAEKELTQARERDASESLIYYNLAIVRLRQKQPDEALKQLEAAFMAGFSHFDAMDKDPDLDPIRNEPKFKNLMGSYRKSA
ncbi:tetratricopeptide repeat protein [Variovorax sp. dw_954]|uniref:tetratricopeptide repeat protein n=1 Tax=Variovorax sp. dw_954 TaxID=2720078 RepID=UPI001BD2F073|nr:tetratricopeptide repeat protein [Variovorax sp. dw_954]